MSKDQMARGAKAAMFQAITGAPPVDKGLIKLSVAVGVPTVGAAVSSVAD